jgi:hypothetical protein
MVFRKWYGGVDWIDLVQNRNEWQAFVNGVMEIGFQKMGEFFNWLRSG